MGGVGGGGGGGSWRGLQKTEEGWGHHTKRGGGLRGHCATIIL